MYSSHVYMVGLSLTIAEYPGGDKFRASMLRS